MTAYPESPPGLDAYLAAIQVEATHFECAICGAWEDAGDEAVIKVGGDLSFDGSVCESCYRQIAAAFGEDEYADTAAPVRAPALHKTEGKAA